MTSAVSRRASVSIGAAVPSLVRWGLSSDADLVFRTITTMGPRSSRMLALELGYRAAASTTHWRSCTRPGRRHR